MSEGKKWDAGIADEVWKVAICGRDIQEVRNLLRILSYYLTSAGSDIDAGLALVRKMTGDEIVGALEAHMRTSLSSVESALAKKTGAQP